MTSAASSPVDRRPASEPPGAAITVTAVLTALWCVGFAIVNIVFEATDSLADGRYADYAAAFTVMNWFVVVLKLLGAAVALLSVADRPRIVRPGILATMVWAAFATLGVYALGSAVQAVGLLIGLTGSADQVGLAGIGYVAFFLLAAAGFGVLAVSHTRRHRTPRSSAVLGVLGGPVVLALVLLGVPALLVALGVMPAYQ
jgi:hypothetical protein